MASYLETSIDQHQLTIKPIKPLGGQGLIEIRGYLREGGLFIVEKTMVSVLHKELEYKVESSSTRGWKSCTRGSESNPNFQLVNKLLRISPHEVLQS